MLVLPSGGLGTAPASISLATPESPSSSLAMSAPASAGQLEIGLIGAGNIGTALARHFSRLGHRVLLSNSGSAEALVDKAKELGATAVTSAEAAKAKDIVVISIPQVFTPKLKPLFAGVSDSVIVIDTNNYYPGFRDDPIPELEETQHDSEWVAQQIGRPVVKAFNSIGSQSLETLAKPRGAEGRVALAVSGGGSDPDALQRRQRVMELVDAIGFDPVDNGDLANSWRQQPGTPGYGQDFTAAKLREALASAEHSKLAEYRRAAEEMARKYAPDIVEQQRRAVTKHQC